MNSCCIHIGAIRMLTPVLILDSSTFLPVEILSTFSANQNPILQKLPCFLPSEAFLGFLVRVRHPLYPPSLHVCFLLRTFTKKGVVSIKSCRSQHTEGSEQAAHTEGQRQARHHQGPLVGAYIPNWFQLRYLWLGHDSCQENSKFQGKFKSAKLPISFLESALSTYKTPSGRIGSGSQIGTGTLRGSVQHFLS